MKSQKGITLIALIIYLIIMCLVLTMLSVISNFFFENKNYITERSKYVAEYNKFNMYFIEDVKNNKNTYKVTENEIIFEDGTVYTYKEIPDNSIYRNKVKICNNITYCKFSSTKEIISNVEKEILKVHMIIESTKLFETNNEYVLKYW